MTVRFFFYLLLLLVVFITGIIVLKKVSKPYRLLTLLIGVTFLSECISRVLARAINSSMPVYHFFSPLEFLGFSAVYYYLITDMRIKKWIKWAMLVMFILSIADTLFYETLFIFPSKYLLVSEVFYLLYSLLGFRQMLLHPIQVPIKQQGFFWVNTAMLIYTCTIFLSFGLHDYLINVKVGIAVVNTFIFYVNIVFYTLLGIAILIDKSEQL